MVLWQEMSVNPSFIREEGTGIDLQKPCKISSVLIDCFLVDLPIQCTVPDAW